jgi:hypothetical protein
MLPQRIIFYSVGTFRLKKSYIFIPGPEPRLPVLTASLRLQVLFRARPGLPRVRHGLFGLGALLCRPPRLISSQHENVGQGPSIAFCKKRAFSDGIHRIVSIKL